MSLIKQKDCQFRIFMGWDSKEKEAYDVAAYSIRKRSSIPVEITPLIQDRLRADGLYWRQPDPLASTEFTYTRFLTPYLAGYQGYAMFVDCDFLFLNDIASLLKHVKEDKAVYCVQHPDYIPRDAVKMDGAVQYCYPRKNWSSLMIFKCDHPSTRKLTVDAINTESGAHLHRMQWCKDEEIGALPLTWNWLEGEYSIGAVHFTRGGPWIKKYESCEYAELWRIEKRSMDDDNGM